MGPKGCQQVLGTMSSNTRSNSKVEVLDFSRNKLESDGSEALAKWLKSRFCDNLRELDLSYCSIDCRALFVAMEASTLLCYHIITPRRQMYPHSSLGPVR